MKLNFFKVLVLLHGKLAKSKNQVAPSQEHFEKRNWKDE